MARLCLSKRFGLEVLSGADKGIANFTGAQTEVRLIPIYDGMPRYEGGCRPVSFQARSTAGQSTNRSTTTGKVKTKTRHRIAQRGILPYSRWTQ